MPTPVYVAILAPLKSTTASSGILSRIVTKSRTSMVPVTVRLVVVVRFPPAAVIADDKPPAVDGTEIEVACTIKKRPKKRTRIRVFFTLLYC